MVLDLIYDEDDRKRDRRNYKQTGCLDCSKEDLISPSELVGNNILFAIGNNLHFENPIRSSRWVSMHTDYFQNPQTIHFSNVYRDILCDGDYKGEARVVDGSNALNWSTIVWAGGSTKSDFLLKYAFEGGAKPTKTKGPFQEILIAAVSPEVSRADIDSGKVPEWFVGVGKATADLYSIYWETDPHNKIFGIAPEYRVVCRPHYPPTIEEKLKNASKHGNEEIVSNAYSMARDRQNTLLLIKKHIGKNSPDVMAIVDSIINETNRNYSELFPDWTF
jgi:hypothetical protein